MTLQLSDLKFRRKILRIRDSLYISVPSLFANADGLEKGQYVEIEIEPDGSLRISKEVDEIV